MWTSGMPLGYPARRSVIPAPRRIEGRTIRAERGDFGPRRVWGRRSRRRDVGRTAVMKLIVFGASGLLGTRLVTEALDRGHELTAVAREATRLDDRGGRVRTASADATDPDSVTAVAGGHDVALSAVTQHQS